MGFIYLDRLVVLPEDCFLDLLLFDDFSVDFFGFEIKDSPEVDTTSFNKVLNIL